MKLFFALLALGIGLALGGGLVYVLLTDSMALFLFAGMVMFILGGGLIGLVLLVNNRVWTNAVFNNSDRKVSNSYNYRFPAPSLPAAAPGYGYPPYQSPLLPAPAPDYFDFPPISSPTHTNDEAIA